MPTVERLFPIAQERLVTLAGGAQVKEAAAMLADKKHRLVVICDARGCMIGVVARRDVVREIGHCLGCSCTIGVSAIMTTDVVVCHSGDTLDEVWKAMTARGLRSIPIIDEVKHPIGVATARDMAELMFSETEYEKRMMREYFMGLGYR